jgi:hypothetical protein
MTTGRNSCMFHFVEAPYPDNLLFKTENVNCKKERRFITSSVNKMIVSDDLFLNAGYVEVDAFVP